MSDEGAVIQGEAYDAAMDSLTQAERNRLLREVESTRQRPTSAATNEDAPHRSWWRYVVRFVGQAIGVILEIAGTVIMHAGRYIKEVSQKI